MGAGELWPFEVVALLWLLPRVRARVAYPTPPPNIQLGTKQNTGHGKAYIPERLAALANAGISGDVADAILAHWALETGWGHGEWNFNVGNRMALKGEPAIDLGVGPRWFRAYESLAAGVADYLQLLRGPRFARAWEMLNAAPSSGAWIAELVRQGYAGAVAARAYVDGVTGCLRRIHAQKNA